LASLSNVNQGVAERSFSEPGGNSLWEMVLHAGSLGTQIEASVGAQEPAFIAKYAFQLAQAFNLFYHHHRVLTEEDQAKKMFFLQFEPPGGTPTRQRARVARNRIPEKM